MVVLSEHGARQQTARQVTVGLSSYRFVGAGACVNKVDQSYKVVGRFCTNSSASIKPTQFVQSAL